MRCMLGNSEHMLSNAFRTLQNAYRRKLEKAHIQSRFRLLLAPAPQYCSYGWPLNISTGALNAELRISFRHSQKLDHVFAVISSFTDVAAKATLSGHRSVISWGKKSIPSRRAVGEVIFGACIIGKPTRYEDERACGAIRFP